MKSTIEPLFRAFSRRDAAEPRSQRRFLAPEDWFEMLDMLDYFPTKGDGGTRNTWDRVWLWTQSAMTHVDELQDVCMYVCMYVCM